MSNSVLGSVTMGYQPVWNAWRQRCATRLVVEPNLSSAVDAQHLLHTLHELWPAGLDAQILVVRTPALLSDLLDHAPAQGLWLEIPDPWLGDALLAGRMRKAQQRGVRLLWRGEAGQPPAGELQSLFHKTLRSITPHEALAALRAALQRTHDSGNTHGNWASPILPGALYEGLASQALVEHALDQQAAWGVAALRLPLQTNPARTPAAAGLGPRHRCRRIAGSTGTPHGQRATADLPFPALRQFRLAVIAHRDRQRSPRPHDAGLQPPARLAHGANAPRQRRCQPAAHPCSHRAARPHHGAAGRCRH